MITQKALKRMEVLAFWEKYGIEAAKEAFKIKERTLYSWKERFIKGGKKVEALNDKSRAPRIKRKRLWPTQIVEQIKKIRLEEHPNIGKEKLYPELEEFCKEHNLECPKPSTIGRLIKDCGGLRVFPKKIYHNGRVKPIKRQKVLRKPKDLQASYPGHVVALDTVERFVYGLRRYIITFEDIYTRFSFAWSTTSHASKAAQEFFRLCQIVFPYPFIFVLTDNGSEFKKHFNQELNSLHLIHYHTYPHTPRMNAHIERFNRTIQEEFIDFHVSDLKDPDIFNRKLIDYLLWYNTKRVHGAFQNKLSPVQFILFLPQTTLIPISSLKINQDCKIGWTYTSP